MPLLNYFVLFLLIPIANSLDRSTPDQITTIMYDLRSSVTPTALRMPCLTWDKTLEKNAINVASRCTLPPTNDLTYAYDIRSDPNTKYTDVLASWLVENMNYDPTTNTCMTGSCDEFKAMFNDQANTFGCSQASCATIPGATGSGPFVYTVCQLDQPRPVGQPYQVSNGNPVGCTNSTCTGPKSVCYNSEICCYPSIQTTTLSSTTSTTSSSTTSLTSTPTTTTTTTTSAASCIDIDPSKCTAMNFNLNPYDSYQLCNKTFNNCKSCTCLDSNFPSGVGGKCKTLPAPFCVVTPVWKKCPLKCNKCSQLLGPNCKPCVDQISGCNSDLCDQMPGKYYPQCQKTCSNCDGCTCVDSITESCSSYVWNGRCATPDGMNYCPVTCNLCPLVRQLAIATSCPSVCYDSNASTDPESQCSQSNCDSMPGKFYPICRKTCNNCDGCTCKDNTNPFASCQEFDTLGLCSEPDQEEVAIEFCPFTCNKCQNVTSFNCGTSSTPSPISNNG